MQTAVHRPLRFVQVTLMPGRRGEGGYTGRVRGCRSQHSRFPLGGYRNYAAVSWGLRHFPEAAQELRGVVLPVRPTLKNSRLPCSTRRMDPETPLGNGTGERELMKAHGGKRNV